jgi:hypothetical protein
MFLAHGRSLLLHSSQDKDLLPLMDCLTNIMARLQMGAQPYAPAMFDKSLKLASLQIDLRKAGAARAAQALQPRSAEFDVDAMVCALDLVRVMYRGRGAACVCVCVTDGRSGCAMPCFVRPAVVG